MSIGFSGGAGDAFLCGAASEACVWFASFICFRKEDEGASLEVPLGFTGAANFDKSFVTFSCEGCLECPGRTGFAEDDDDAVAGFLDEISSAAIWRVTAPIVAIAAARGASRDGARRSA